MRLKHDLIILLVLAFTLVSARAQDNSGFDGKFVGIKFGGYDTFIPFASEKHQQTFGSPENLKVPFGGQFVNLSYNVLKNRTVYTAELGIGTKLSLAEGRSSQKFANLGFLYGRMDGKGSFWIQYQGGLTTVYGREPAPEDDRGSLGDTFLTGGLIGKTVFKFIPSQSFGIGIDLEVFVLPQVIFYTAGVSFEFGKQRKAK